LICWSTVFRGGSVRTHTSLLIPTRGNPIYMYCTVQNPKAPKQIGFKQLVSRRFSNMARQTLFQKSVPKPCILNRKMPKFFYVMWA
jgi:hypothetical protein